MRTTATLEKLQNISSELNTHKGIIVITGQGRDPLYGVFISDLDNQLMFSDGRTDQIIQCDRPDAKRIYVSIVDQKTIALRINEHLRLARQILN